MSGNRIDAVFPSLQAEGKKAFVAYVVAGDPSLDATAEVVVALAQAGASIIELGVPFSDPLADGTVNQMGAQRALQAGATLQGIFDCVRAIRAKSQVPLVLFSYFNPLFRYGLSQFLQDAEAAGAVGVLIVDLPMEEARREWPSGCALRLISLIAPTTPEERLARITAQSSGFIYYVSREGVTGMQQQLAEGLSSKVERLRAHTKLPLCVGFGISTAEQVRSVAAVADGVVVGSAIVNVIGKHEKADGLAQKVVEFARPLIEACKQ